jgi:hypothetical protein
VSTAISACMKKAIKDEYKNPKMKSNSDKTLAIWIINSSSSNMLIKILNLSTD